MRILGDHALFTVDNPHPILSVVPEAKHTVWKGVDIIAVPNTLGHLQLMRSFGLHAPAPVEDYAFPGRFMPYSHQRETMRFLVENKRAYNLSGMGTGKTCSSLWASDYLMQKGVVRRCLIVAPLSCLERVWGDSIYQTLHYRKFVILHGSKQTRLDLLKTDWDYAVVNHHGVEIIAPHLPEDLDLIVIDELAVARNHKAKTIWGALKGIIKPHHWVWGMTGSPTPNAPTDAWAQSKLITPERYNGSFTRFKMDTMLQVSQFKYIPRRNAENFVQQILKPSIRYALEDCIDLPETIYHDRPAELSKEQHAAYNKMLASCITEIRGMEVTAVNAAVLMGKLIQIAVGVAYGKNDTAELDFGPRLSVIEECIEEADGKVIIFLPLTGALHALHNKLRKKWTCAVIEGGTSAGQRNKTFSDFNEKDSPHIIIANPGTMSHGLNLHHKCHTIIWATAVTSHEIYCQANARTVRPGQKHSTNIIHIYATPVEQKVYKTLKERGKFQDTVLELVKK